LGFEVWGLGFGVWGLGFGAWGLSFGVWGLGFAYPPRSEFGVGGYTLIDAEEGLSIPMRAYRLLRSLQGYLTYKKTHPLRTLPYAYA